MQEDELDALRSQVEAATKESMNNMLRAPLERLKDVVQKLHDVTGKTERASINKKTGATEVKPPIFRDSVCENIMEEIELLQAFADVLPFEITSLARTVVDMTPHPQQLRDNPDKRKEVNVQTAALLASIESMLED
jgi:ATP phosphoribosyltransferase